MADETSEALKNSAVLNLGSPSPAAAAEIVTRSEEGTEKEETPSAGSTSGVPSDSEAISDLNQSPAQVGETKVKGLEDDKSSWVIDIKSSGAVAAGGGVKEEGNLDGESICRICHLCSDPSSQTPPRTTTNAPNLPVSAIPGLIQLGCNCKDELGAVHVQCAEAWFKLKGNRQCEICGECAKNITGVGDNNRFIEEWNDGTPASTSNNRGREGGGCLRGQPILEYPPLLLPAPALPDISDLSNKDLSMFESIPEEREISGVDTSLEPPASQGRNFQVSVGLPDGTIMIGSIPVQSNLQDLSSSQMEDAVVPSISP